jgi:hypothetical protein
LEQAGLDRRIILKWAFKKWNGEALTGLIWLRIGTGSCECCNEYLGSIKCGEFLELALEPLASPGRALCSMELLLR